MWRADRPVALKLLADHLAEQPEFVRSLLPGSPVSVAFSNTPTFVQGYASGFDPDSKKHYLVMEFIDGPTAHGALTHGGRLSLGMVVRIGIDIARRSISSTTDNTFTATSSRTISCSIPTAWRNSPILG